jgi:hypothetical protein
MNERLIQQSRSSIEITTLCAGIFVEPVPKNNSHIKMIPGRYKVMANAIVGSKLTFIGNMGSCKKKYVAIIKIAIAYIILGIQDPQFCNLI